MDCAKRRFLVIGLGPVGGIFAASLTAAGYSVTGLDIWEDHVDGIDRNGLSIEGLVSIKSRLSQVCTSFGELEETAFDYVVIAVKASVMELVISQLGCLQGDFKVVSLQNGIDNEEFIGEHIGRDRTMRIVVNYAGTLVDAGRVRMTFFNKPNYVGCLCSGTNCSHARELAQIMTGAGLQAEATTNIKKCIWRKAILNAALTPVCALLDMTMAEVMSHHETFHVVEMILDECIRVAKARGYDFGQGFLDYCLDYLSRGGHHRPSMLRDLKRGLKTEIDFLNGKIVSHGRRLGVPVPVNTTLTAMVKAREAATIEERKRQEKMREDQ